MRPARVLVVDDESTFRCMIVDLLGQNGFACTEAPDGRSAVALINTESFDLGVFDIVLPGMSGWELASIAQAVSPTMRLIAVTGYACSVDLAAFRFEIALQKPFSPMRLVSICRHWSDSAAEDRAQSALN